MTSCTKRFTGACLLGLVALFASGCGDSCQNQNPKDMNREFVL